MNVGLVLELGVVGIFNSIGVLGVFELGVDGVDVGGDNGLFFCIWNYIGVIWDEGEFRYCVIVCVGYVVDYCVQDEVFNVDQVVSVIVFEVCWVREVD